ncbi:MAG: hypothetical protein IPG81_11755 [Sandaracinaceae bacterium]|nr:hypothetical protein [Sandaracinaceae bacterium]
MRPIRVDLRIDFAGFPNRSERCGAATRLSEDQLRPIQVVVDVRGPRTVVVTYSEPSALPGAAALLRCLQAEVSRALLSYRRSPHPVRTGAFTVQPFAVLDLPMEPTPLAAARALTPGEVDALLAELRAAPDDATRLARIAQLEQARVALPATTARAVLATFSLPDALTGGLLCRVLTGRGALRAVQGALPAYERARLRGLTRGACGVNVIPVQADPIPSSPATPGLGILGTRPPGDPRIGQPTPTQAECTTHADCVLACPVPPDCCPATCGCSHAVPRSEAAGIAAACQGVRNRECPAMGCARQEFHAICRAGQCRAERGMGMF